DLLSPLAALRGGDHLGHRYQPPRAHQREVDERGRTQAERFEDAILTEAIERSAGEFFDRLSEQDEAEIAVHDGPAGLRLGLLAMDELVDVLLGAVAAEEVDAPGAL